MSHFSLKIEKWDYYSIPEVISCNCGIQYGKAQEKGLDLATEAHHPWRGKTVLTVPGRLLSRRSLLA